MIKISSPLRQQEIIELLNAYTDDDVSFVFKEKKGIALLFETSATDHGKAAKLAKAHIKNQPWGSVLSFQSIAI